MTFTSLRYNLFDIINSLIPKEILQMTYYSNASQLYFDFVYDQYLNEHSESKYLLDLINVID